MIPFTITVEKSGGGSLTFTHAARSELSYIQSVSFDGDTVQSDELSAVIRQTPADWLSQWNGVTRNSPVILSSASPGQRTEKYYHKSLRRVAKSDFRLTAQSPVGRLTSDFPGDIFTGQTLPVVLAAILTNPDTHEKVVPYTVNPLLESVRVYGWAPYQSRRETIHALALAFGFLIRRDNNQNIYFTVPDTTSYTIPDNALFTGGSIAYRVGETYHRADITASDYLQRNEPEQTLFDNSSTAPVENLIVKFNAPMFDVHASGNLTVHDSGVNYARVSGLGVLYGTPYTKITSIVSIEGDPDADPEHILSVTDAPLITSLNAVSVGEKLLSYHNAPAVVSVDIVRTNQRAGDFVAFTDPFGDAQTGYITTLSGSITSFDRASASIVCGYVPVWGAAFDAVEILTENSDEPWVVPEHLDGKKIRVVLIGGGTGGASGQHGTDANGVGCGHGLPGSGGKILDVKITVTAGQSFAYQIGTGGAGGTYTDDISSDTGAYVSNPGQAGSDTTFGDLSTEEDGEISDYGYYDAINAVQYAITGSDNGVDGGAATTGTENGNQESPGWNDVERATITLPWDSTQSWSSGNPGNGLYERTSTPEGPTYEWAYGGLGGGAAVGNDGSDGENARFTSRFFGGNGGNGADASAIFPNDTRTYGSGGSGGHGGGEGATGGSAHSDYGKQDGSRGSGGAGSNGQNGANGCILIYYKANS